VVKRVQPGSIHLDRSLAFINMVATDNLKKLDTIDL
jgi:hypothetical protein